MTVSAACLTANKEALRHHQIQMVARSGHRDVEQPALLLDLLGVPVARSDGMQPSTTLRTKTARHSWPLAEWMVERMR